MKPACLNTGRFFFYSYLQYISIAVNQMETLKRIQSIDLLRGLVMVIMALDHTREYFHISAMTANPLDPASTTTALFFTRWITHFCAPIFVFLSGLSACLSAQRNTPAQASSFLFKRGVWLIVVEVVIVTFGLTFNPSYNWIILQVIWVIGWSMILLSIVSRISYKLVVYIGILLVAGHNLLNYINLPQAGASAIFIKVLFTAAGTLLPLDPTHLLGVFYAILPWTGILFIGYGCGTWFKRGYPAFTRRKNLFFAGLALTALFIILRLVNGYGDPSLRKDFPLDYQDVLSFLNTSKYPPSLLYFCMTIGPALLFLAFWESTKNRLTKVISMYGSVPFFYYILHFYLLHLLLVAAFFLTGHTSREIVQVPFYFRPEQFGFSLPVVYLIWLGVVVMLYQPCVWFKNYKATNKHWWLRYV